MSGKVAKGYAPPTGNRSVPNQAKAQFSALLDRVEHKERLVITRRNRPIGDLQAAFDGQTA